MPCCFDEGLEETVSPASLKRLGNPASLQHLCIHWRDWGALPHCSTSERQCPSHLPCSDHQELEGEAQGSLSFTSVGTYLFLVSAAHMIFDDNLTFYESFCGTNHWKPDVEGSHGLRPSPDFCAHLGPQESLAMGAKLEGDVVGGKLVPILPIVPRKSGPSSFWDQAIG